MTGFSFLRLDGRNEIKERGDETRKKEKWSCLVDVGESDVKKWCKRSLR